MKKRFLLIICIVLMVLLLAMILRWCGSDNAALRTIHFRQDASWVRERTADFLDPLTLLEDGKGISAEPLLIDLRFCGETVITYMIEGKDSCTVQRRFTVIEPLITLRRNRVYVPLKWEYDQNENIISDYAYETEPESIDTSACQNISVTVRAKAEGLEKEAYFEVIVTDRKLVWIVDQPARPQQIIDLWVVDCPAVSEQGHWEIIEPATAEQGHYEEVEVEEKGHWEKVVIREEVAEQGHWQIIHHEAVTHQRPIYEQYKYWIFEFSDGYSIKIYQYELEEMGLTATQYAAKYEDSHPGVTGKWHSGIEKRLVGYETVVDQPAYDEEVWIIDVPYQPPVTEDRWVIDEKAHTERRWVIDVPARPEKRQWVIDQPAHPEEGHWQQQIIPEVPEVGHWQPVD